MSTALLMLMTTLPDRASARRLAQRLKSLHPYEVPELIALPVVKGLPEYLDWAQSVTRRTE
jgi:periplasmic divalent cation tolerance protein